MQAKGERDLIRQITEQYGRVIDLERAPGVMVEILREFGPNIFQVLGEEPGHPEAEPGIAIAGPSSPSVTLEDVMRIVLELRQEVMKLSQRVGGGR
jgi:hypothetical protein